MEKLIKIVRRKKRLGRGIGSRGAKSGRGMKGQRSRAGSHQKSGFEGGQTPLYMRLPKGRGAKQGSKSQMKKYCAIDINQLTEFEDGKIVGPGQLAVMGLAGKKDRIKIVGRSWLNKKLTVRVHKVTKGAQETIERAGGKVEIIE